MQNMEKVGKIIAELRRERGLRQSDLSQILSMSPSNISNYENANYWPDAGTICKMANLFNITTDYLLGRTDYRCPPEDLERYVTPDYTIHNIVNTLLSLDTNSVNAVVKYVEYLKESQTKDKQPNS